MIQGALEYQNVPMIVGKLISARMATLHELDQHLSIEDAWDALEILSVDAHNNYHAHQQMADRQHG